MLAEICADFLVCAVGIFLLCLFSLRVETPIPLLVREIAAISVVVASLIALLLHKDGAYRGGGSLLRIRETDRAIRASVQSLLLLLPLSMLADLKFPPAMFLVALVLIPILLIGEKHIFFSIIRLLNKSGYGTDRVVVYGAGETGRRIVSALLCSPRLGLSPIAVIDDDPDLAGGSILEWGYRRSRSVPVRRGPVTPALLQSLECNLLIMPNHRYSAEDRADAVRAASQAGSRVAFLTAQALHDRCATEFVDVDGLVLTASNGPIARWYYATTKRVVDIAGSVLFLVLLAPLFFLIALLVRLDSPGPAFFIQKRVGRNGRLFHIYKFRSMYAGTAQYDFSPLDIRDRRITRMGRFLRRTSLDELPQLINVLLGDMSLVGPRPEMPFIVQHYNPRQRRRLEVTPGITGLWQISADRSFQIHENIHYDLYYIRHRTFFMDLSILIHTIFFAMHGI
jgi:exopolysaccharide biosynthesis polyprenyl glycosylphosphotransferase